MSYLLYLFGFLPSIIWLLFYLRKDSHPESNRMILKIFFFGILAAFFVIFLEKGAAIFLKKDSILAIFLGGALIEEYSKYLAVRIGVYKNSELDEPVDILLYMIISALGFASLENILVLFGLGLPFDISDTVALTILRFLGATFLHALCSGTIGFFLALSLFEAKNKFKLVFSGLIIATFLHGLFNFSIIELEGSLRIIIPGIILLGLGIFVLLAFQKLKTIASVCKLK